VRAIGDRAVLGGRNAESPRPHARLRGVGELGIAAPSGRTAQSWSRMRGAHRQRVRDRGDEHVAGDAADQIEWIARVAGAGVTRDQATTGTTSGLGDDRERAVAAPASASASACSTDPGASTHVRLTSSASRPVVKELHATDAST
jgi:hypothetical protein